MKKTFLLVIFFGLAIIMYLLFVHLDLSQLLSYMLEGSNMTSESSKLRDISQSLERYSTPYSCKDCNVVLVSIDTLRADHTGFMGYFRNTTPNLDNLAKDSIVFDNAFVQAPHTLPSHASIFTSLYLFQHGAIDKLHPKYGYPIGRPMKENVVTLAEIMNNEYETAGFVDDGFVSARFGLSRGFKLYDDKNYFLESINNSIDWLEDNKNRKFFLFAHTYYPHEPYGDGIDFSNLFVESNYTGQFKLYDSFNIKDLNDARENGTLSEDDIEYIIAKYDGDVRQADKNVGMLIDKLKELHLYNETILIIFSDHGEYLNDHPKSKYAFAHSDLYDPVLRQVLIIKHPKFDFSKRIKQVVSSIDIAPTILELTGIGRFNQFKGKSLVNGIFNENNESFSISSDEHGTSTTIRSLKWKLIVRADGFLELYNAEYDKKSSNNIVDSNPDVVNRLLKILEGMEIHKNKELPEEINISDSKLIENLKRLGYIS